MKCLRMFVVGFVAVLGSLLPGYASADTQYNFSFRGRHRKRKKSHDKLLSLDAKAAIFAQSPE